MAEVTTFTFGDLSSNQPIELPMPMNPFEEQLQKTMQERASQKLRTYKTIGDRLYKLFVTEQAKNEVNNLFTQARVTS